MKITLVISQLVKGGAERVVCNLANYLSKENEVTIVSFRGKKCEYDLDEKVKVKYVDDESKLKIIRVFERRNKLKNILTEEKRDVILCFLPKPSYLVLSMKKNLASKIIVSVRNDPKVEYKDIINYALMKMLYKKSDGFVFQTEEAKDYFSKDIQQKSKIILNSVNPNFLKPLYTGIRNKEIVSVGRLNTQKNYELLINAFFRVSKKYPEYKLTIYGEGSERQKLEKIISDNNMESRISLPGTTDHVEEKINTARLFVLPSQYEGMPNALIEAMSLGIPCISTDCPCGGPRMLIKNYENGVLVKNNDLEQLVYNIEKILSDDKLTKKLSENSIKIQERINPDIVNKEWENYIKKIYEDR